MAAERKEEARSANAAARREQQDKNDAKKRMKGKNKPSRRQRKKQLNVIEERKGKQPIGVQKLPLHCRGFLSWPERDCAARSLTAAKQLAQT